MIQISETCGLTCNQLISSKIIWWASTLNGTRFRSPQTFKWNCIRKRGAWVNRVKIKQIASISNSHPMGSPWCSVICPQFTTKPAWVSPKVSKALTWRHRANTITPTKKKIRDIKGECIHTKRQKLTFKNYRSRAYNSISTDCKTYVGKISCNEKSDWSRQKYENGDFICGKSK